MVARIDGEDSSLCAGTRAEGWFHRGQIDNAKPEDGGIIAKSGYFWSDAPLGVQVRSTIRKWHGRA